MKEENKVHKRKGWRNVGNTLEEGPEAGMLNEILGKEVRECGTRQAKQHEGFLATGGLKWNSGAAGMMSQSPYEGLKN